MGRMESFLVRTANRETGHRVTEATRRRLTETQMPYDALSIRIARYQMEMANNSLLQDLSCSYSQHDSKNLVSINTFSNAPEEVTQMSLPPYQLPEGADDDAFHELWQITLRVFEIRDQEICKYPTSFPPSRHI